MIARCTEEHRKNVTLSWRHREDIDAWWQDEDHNGNKGSSSGGRVLRIPISKFRLDRWIQIL
jgi:hypothetical protein